MGVIITSSMAAALTFFFMAYLKREVFRGRSGAGHKGGWVALAAPGVRPRCREVHA